MQCDINIYSWNGQKHQDKLNNFVESKAEQTAFTNDFVHSQFDIGVNHQFYSKDVLVIEIPYSTAGDLASTISFVNSLDDARSRRA